MSMNYLKKPVKKVEYRRRDEERLTFLFITVVLFLTFILLYFLPKAVPSKELMLETGKGLLAKTMLQFIELGFKEIELKSAPKGQTSITFELPDGCDITSVVEQAENRVNISGLKIRKTNLQPDNHVFSLFINYFAEPVGVISFIRKESDILSQKAQGVTDQKPLLVVLIDDFGYSNNDVVLGFLQLKVNLTLSVIPGHSYSRWVAEMAKKNHKEIIIHMPMEPENGNYTKGEEKFMLRKAMTAMEIEDRLNLAFEELPSATGLSNHMGSLATADSALMKIIAGNLRKKGLYFIDSLTSPKSVGFEIAGESGVPTAIRTVFLDNKRDKSEIQAQFESALEIARRSGKAVAVGHVCSETLDVLKDLINSGCLAGVELVFASEIVS